MPTIPLSFPGAQGAALAARLELPAGPPRAFALFAHCFTCGKQLRSAHAISRGLAAAGIATLRFDFTGLGESEGDFADTGLATNVDDLVAAAEHLAAHYEAPALLVGHSLGGAAVLMAAARLPAARAVVTLNAPGEPAHMLRLLEPARPEVEARGCAMVSIAGSRFPITRAFLDELEATRMAATIRELGRPLLILHAPGDAVVGVDNAAQIFQAARHPKSFLALDEADHLLSNEADAAHAAALIAAWAGRYLPAPAQAEPDHPAEAGVLVRVGAQGYTSTVRAGRHALIADEPAALGGADLGPTPYDYLLAGLGACTTITLRMYADRKGWPLEAATVRLRHSRVHAADCADCETKEGRIDQIERELELAGPLDAEQRARLAEIADRCPVHRTLHGEIKVRTSVVEADGAAPPPAE